jgi:hypothetical protein
MRVSAVLSTWVVVTGCASAALIVGDDMATATVTKAAASTVTENAENLLEFETVQLLDSDLDFLDNTRSAIFSFDDENVVNIKTRPTANCKTFPGDLAWPSTVLWSTLNELLGGVLIKTIPIAAPCYVGPYYVRIDSLINENETKLICHQNAARCSAIISSWTDSAFQYV